MFIAHIPSGYILAKFLEKKLKATGLSKKTFFALLMVGAVFPDLDLFYFYFIDGRSVHHHKYFVHWFSVWLPIFFAPFIDRPYVFFEVTPRYQPWWLNFILHWSFLVELLICVYALYLYFRKNEVLR